MFGYELVDKNEIELLRRDSRILRFAIANSYWFIGWPDVMKLLGRLLSDGAQPMDHVRSEYALMRGTDIYGKPL